MVGVGWVCVVPDADFRGGEYAELDLQDLALPHSIIMIIIQINIKQRNNNNNRIIIV